jgi:uncharacterized protein
MAKLAPTLYDLSVPTFLQTLRSVGGCLDRTIRHCAATGADVEEVVNSRLVPDMAPFHFQIEALKNHAVWGMEAAKTGAFDSPMPFADLRAMVRDAITALEALTPDEVNSWSGRKLDIQIYQPLDEDNATTSSWGPRTLAFTPETFLLSYSLPNFYFHSVTAYNILRTRGVPLGKYHFQGQLRTRPD